MNSCLLIILQTSYEPSVYRDMVEKKYSIPMYYMNVSTLPLKITDFCGNFSIIKVKEIKTEADMEMFRKMIKNLVLSILLLTIYISKLLSN